MSKFLITGWYDLNSITALNFNLLVTNLGQLYQILLKYKDETDNKMSTWEKYFAHNNSSIK